MLLAKVLLEEIPQLLNLYLKLDKCSERGGSPVDEFYASRINALDPESLVNHLNICNLRSHREIASEQHSRQLKEIEKECEKQFLLANDLAFKFKHIYGLLAKYEKLVDRLLFLEVNSTQ